MNMTMDNCNLRVIGKQAAPPPHVRPVIPYLVPRRNIDSPTECSDFFFECPRSLSMAYKIEPEAIPVDASIQIHDRGL